MGSWTPTTYKTRNWAEYNLSLKQRGSLAIWFDPEMVWDAAPSGDEAVNKPIAARDAHAVIPPRKNAKMWKPDTPEARARNEAVRSSKYLGRALWRRWSGYHRRSRVETKMHCVKLLGQRLSARDFNRQVAEIQIRAAILNGFTALSIPRTVAVG